MEKKVIEDDERIKVTETKVHTEDGFVPLDEFRGTVSEKDRFTDLKGEATNYHMSIDVSDGISKKDIKKMGEFYKEGGKVAVHSTFTKSNFKKAMIKPLLIFTPFIFIFITLIGSLIGDLVIGLAFALVATIVMWAFTMLMYAFMRDDSKDQKTIEENKEESNNNQ